MPAKIISHAKSLLILALAVLSVYLTMHLWFVYFTDRNFVPYLQARLAPAVPDWEHELVRPFRIVHGVGDGYFGIAYSEITEHELWRNGRAIITAVLQSGSFVSQQETDMAEILGAPVVIFEYAFYMNTTVFAQAFGRRVGSLLLERDLDNFHAVAVHPGQGRIFFIGEDYTWEYTLGVPHLPVALTDAGVRFVHVNGLEFAPQFDDEFSYNPVSAHSPYRTFGQLHLAFIRGQVEHFFDNPATVTHGRVGYAEIFTFSNLNTVVRYLPWDVVEYTSFRTIGRAAATGLAADFSAAYAFVYNDPNVTNEFFLAGYEQRGRGYVFWFGYVINNFPMVMTEPWYTGPHCLSPLVHPIEVVVDHGRVVYYRKIAYNFDVNTRAVEQPQEPTGHEFGFPIVSGIEIRLQH